MIVSLLLAGLYFIGLVAGDDSSSSADDDVTITSMTTANPTYTVLAPMDSPTLDLFGSVTFIWSAEGYNVGGYFCRPSTTSSGFYLYTSWMPSEAGNITSKLNRKRFGRQSKLMMVASSRNKQRVDDVRGRISWVHHFCVQLCRIPSDVLLWHGNRYQRRARVHGRGRSIRGVNVISWRHDCVNANDDLRYSTDQHDLSSAKTAFVTATSTVPPTSTVQPTAIQPPPIETIPEPFLGPEDSHDLSRGAIVGIVVGSVSGALILVGFAIWRKTVRQRTSASEAMLSGLEEAIAPTKASFRKKFPAGDQTSSSIERGDVVHEMSVPNQSVRVFELESPPQRYTNSHHELSEN